MAEVKRPRFRFEIEWAWPALGLGISIDPVVRRRRHWGEHEADRWSTDIAIMLGPIEIMLWIARPFLDPSRGS